MRRAIWFLMDQACERTGHRMWTCYNFAPTPVKRLWFWSWDL
jgi:hypothetical protein